MGMPRAIVWDVDGTLAETERDGHRVAFNEAFARHGLPWQWDEAHYGGLLRVAGGRERLVHDLERRTKGPADATSRHELARALHQTKNHLYADIVRSGRIPLRTGVRELLAECHARGVPMGIATTSSRSNVAALLSSQLGPDWQQWFDAIVCGEDVSRKKPDPEAYDKAVAALGVAAGTALAIEDSPDGVMAARKAGLPVLVTRSHYFADAAIEGTVAIGPGLGQRDGWTPSPAAECAAGGRITFDDLEIWFKRSTAR
jgi:HAD superfamily hydrolase (TIGR01509 family)